MSKGNKKLFLLDAMALIYRAHFAFSKNPRINSKGLNTGVMLGFTNTLLEILEKEKPSHIAVVFDTSAPTFRHVQFEAYKANRQAQPEDIAVGIPWVKLLISQPLNWMDMRQMTSSVPSQNKPKKAAIRSI